MYNRNTFNDCLKLYLISIERILSSTKKLLCNYPKTFHYCWIAPLSTGWLLLTSGVELSSDVLGQKD